MTLWLGTHLLLAGLVLASSAPTNEECRPLMTPQALTDPSKISGKFYFIAGYTNNDFFNSILNRTDSSWIEISSSPDNPEKLNMVEFNKLSGSCFLSHITITISGHIATASASNVTTDFQMLPGCEGCLALNMNSSIRNLDYLLKAMKIDMEGSSRDITAQSVYLLAKETSLQESDLELFKKQASCFGFTREPDYQYDPKKAFCQKDEAVHIPL